MLMFNDREKQFIIEGPQLLRPELQSTQCSLFLNVDGADAIALFRATLDPYADNYNICDLPELPSDFLNEQKARLNLSRSNRYDQILAAMQYDEALQVALFKSKM